MTTITCRLIFLGFLSGLIVIAVGGCGQQPSAPPPSAVAHASTYKPAPGPNPGLAVIDRRKALEQEVGNGRLAVNELSQAKKSQAGPGVRSRTGQLKF
jgi:hypothetical protein